MSEATSPNINPLNNTANSSPAKHKGLRFRSRNTLPMIYQTEAAECGIACLAMVASYHGFKMDFTRFKSQFNTSLAGNTLLQLCKFAESLNLSGRGIKVPLESLQEVQAPAVLHWELNHFVVLKSANRKGIVIHDPAKGVRKYSYAEASKLFTGVVLELSPTQDFTPTDDKQTLKLSDLWSDITGLKKALLNLFGLSVLLQIIALITPYYVQLAVDDVVVTRDLDLLNSLLLVFTLFLIFELAIFLLRKYTMLRFSSSLNLQLSVNLFHHVIRLPLSYFESRHIGDLLSRFGSLEPIRRILTTEIIEAVLDGLMVITTLTMMFFYSETLAFIVLGIALSYSGFRLYQYPKLRKVSEAELVNRAKEQSYFIESARGVQAIKLFNAESSREMVWQNLYVDTLNQTIRLGQLQITQEAVLKALQGLEQLLVVYFAATLITSGDFSVGMMFAFFAYRTQFSSRFTLLIEKIMQFRILNLHFDRLSDIVMTPAEKPAQQTINTGEIIGDIRLEGVTFSYPNTKKPIIDNLSIHIAAGESVAITGPSGCGKSTLLKLMVGLYQPEQGQILIDNRPLANLSKEFYRKNVAVIMQEDQLMSGSIADNIAFFDTDIDMEKVLRVSKLAAVHDSIMNMPMGYESVVGDMGSILSGGQKQRILLARALYKETKILFMDEATSHLDQQLELTINKAIAELNITRVIIAHRQETIASAQRVIHLQTHE